MSASLSDYAKWFLLIAVIAVPIFRSGVKSNMTFLEFTINHTIFTPDPEYIPREDYAAIFSRQDVQGLT